MRSHPFRNVFEDFDSLVTSDESNNAARYWNDDEYRHGRGVKPVGQSEGDDETDDGSNNGTGNSLSHLFHVHLCLHLGIIWFPYKTRLLLLLECAGRNNDEQAAFVEVRSIFGPSRWGRAVRPQCSLYLWLGGFERMKLEDRHVALRQAQDSSR